MLIAPLLGIAMDATTAKVAQQLADHFEYLADDIQFGPGVDNWPARDEVAANIERNGGVLMDDCDGFAFCAAYVLHDLGRGARVVIGADETGKGHMVCEDEFGNVIDNRQPGRLCTWPELEQTGYRSTEMNALNFESAPTIEWRFVKVGNDGRRIYD